MTATPRRRARLQRVQLALLLTSVSVLAMDGEPFRFTQPILAKPGWSVLALPDDVLDHSQADLSDLRIAGPNGELSYAPEKLLAPVTPRLPLLNVERLPAKETSALVDRGEHREACSELTLEVTGNEPFLKPIVLEASDDRAVFRELARGSVFRTVGGTMTTLHFPANNRRFLRIRLDDRDGDPIAAEAVVLEHPSPPPSLRSVPVTITSLTTSSASEDSYAIHLPTRHLPVVALKLGSSDPVFSRTVHVYERVLFRDQLTRRSVSVGQIARGANGREALEVPLAAISGSNFEIDIERLGPALTITEASVTVLPKRIVFLAPAKGELELSYGSSRAHPPHYDLAAALSLGRPEQLTEATLGTPQDHGATPDAPNVAPTRGGPVTDAAWPFHAAITLPKDGSVAYLDLGDEVDRGLRIIDQEQRQVPYVLESGSQYTFRNASLALHTDQTQTLVTLSALNPKEKLLGIELYAKSPEYFSRRVSAYESISDARAVTGQRSLGAALWERQPGDEDTPFNLDIESPTQSSLTIELDNGDNPPLELARATLKIARRRIDFLFAPGDQLTLLYGNPNAGEPSYDLRLLGPTLIAMSAQAALLEPVASRATPATSQPTKWLWIAVVFSAALVLLALMRTLRKGSTSDPGKEP
jgi:hypothetical protein